MHLMQVKWILIITFLQEMKAIVFSVDDGKRSPMDHDQDLKQNSVVLSAQRIEQESILRFKLI